MERYKLNNWVRYWIVTYKAVTVKKSTFDSYLYNYSTHITADIDIRELSADDIQRIINKMALDGYSTSTIKHCLTLIRQALKKALNLGIIKDLNMLNNLELPPRREKTISALELNEQQSLIHNLGNSIYKDFFIFLIYTGVRVGEAIALTWADVDFFTGTIHIRNTDYNGELQPVKTRSGIRDLPMFDKIKEILINKQRGLPGERVFTNSLGRPICYRSALDSWHRVCEHAGIYNKSIGLHQLRHTFAYTSIRRGVPVKVVAAWLGHSDVLITLKIYDSVLKQDLLTASETISLMYG